MARESSCVFCRIVSVDVPAAVVYESDSTVALLDIGPLAEGHLLIVPRDHYARVVDVPSNLFGQLAAAVPMLGRALCEVTRAEGFNLLVNDGPVAGQVVPHVHLHLIPRRGGDGLGYRWQAGKYPEGRAAQIASAMQDALARRESWSI